MEYFNKNLKFVQEFYDSLCLTKIIKYDHVIK